MISLIIAGGVYVAATTQTTTTQWIDINNHTLRGETILASQVVCRNRWGTPMLPDGKGGYSLIAPINPIFIRESLIIPPKTTTMVAYRPLPPIIETRTIVVPATPQSGPAAPAPDAAPAPAAESTFDAAPAPAGTDALPAADTAAPAAEAPAADTGGFAPPSGS
jgi:hypothetical protein